MISNINKLILTTIYSYSKKLKINKIYVFDTGAYNKIIDTNILFGGVVNESKTYKNTKCLSNERMFTKVT
jgi:hypothetical protein